MSLLFKNLAKLVSLGSSPSSKEEGDVWWRSDKAQINASDGLNGPDLQIGPSGNLPVIRSGQWTTLPTSGSFQSLNLPDGRLYALPLWPGQSSILSAVAVNVTLALVGGNVRMGLYSSDGSTPTNLIQDFGTVSTGLTGIQQLSSLSAFIRPSLHFLVAARQGGLLTLGVSSSISGDPMVFSSAPEFSSGLTSYYKDGVTGALPASFGVIAGSILGPAMSVQFS